jgi:NADH-quinone oxidoreductase subunit G
MPQIEINGKSVDVPANINIIEAAKTLGIEIPHYCFHEGLHVVGSCRMCQVEVEQHGRRSLVIGCSTTVADGMKVFTDTEPVRKQRQMVLEFLLQHHPLDCPICDDAGECDLQNYYMEHGLHDSRIELSEKLHKHKAFDAGPTIVLDSERCVLCSRCVRFLLEITGTGELAIFGQGETSELMTIPAVKLDNPYAGCVVDLCPVGALTDKDFRFKRRVWYLKSAPSICMECSRGCNIEIDYDTHRPYKAPSRRIQRLKPRYNKSVNEWWMCDRGRYSYHPVDAADRLTSVQARASNGDSAPNIRRVLQEVARAIKTAKEKHGTKSIAVIASAKSSNEDLYLLHRLFVQHLGLHHVDVALKSEPIGPEDEILRKSDLTPNRRGAFEIGFRPATSGKLSGDDILKTALAKEIQVLIVVRHDLGLALPQEHLARLGNLNYVLYLAEHGNATTGIAHGVIPLATWAERDGSYTNFQGRVQRTTQAFPPLGAALPEWEIWRLLGAEVGLTIRAKNAEEVFADLAKNVTAFRGLTWDSLVPSGRMLAGVPEPAYRKVQTSRPLE